MCGVPGPSLPFEQGRAMHRILTSIVGFHWAAQFGLIAAAAAGLISPDQRLAGYGAGFPAELGETLAAGTALGFGLAAILFSWLLVSALFDRRMPAGETDDVARLAVAMAVGMLTLLVIAAAAGSLTISASVLLLQVAALLVSYLAIDAERRHALESVEDAPLTGASSMALSAAHNALLIRISGRSGPKGSL
jgi:hypothetical protein